MGIHSYLSGEYAENKAKLDACEKRISETVLSSEPSSQFSFRDAVQVSTFNSVIEDLMKIVKNPVCVYLVNKSAINHSDSFWGAKIGDSISDISQLTSTFKSMTEVMNVSEKNGMTFKDGLGGCMSEYVYSGITKIKISDYVTIDENGKYSYNYEKIDQIFSDMKSDFVIYEEGETGLGQTFRNIANTKIGGVSEEDYYIVEAILYTCALGDDLNVEAIEKILNSSKNMIGANETAYIGDIPFKNYNGKYSEFWKRVASDIGSVNSYLMKCNSDLLGDPSKNEELGYRRLVNFNALSDVTTAFSEYAGDIEDTYRTKLYLESKLPEVEEKASLNDWDRWNLYSKLLIMEYGMTAGQLDDYAENMRKRLENCNTEINLEFVSHNVDDEIDRSIGGRYKLSVNGKEKANIYEFSECTNDTISNAIKDDTKYTATKILESFKYNAETKYKSADDYVNEKFTAEDKLRVGLDIIESLPVVGDTVSLVDDCVTVVDDIYEITEDNGKSIDEAAASGTDVISDIINESNNKKVKAGSKSILKIVKVGFEVHGKIEDYKKEYNNMVAYDKEIEELQTKVNAESDVEKVLEKIKDHNKEIYPTKDNRKVTAEKEHFSFTVHTNQKIVVSDNRIS